MLATGAAAVTATAIAFAPPPPADPLPIHSAAPVALTGAWQDLQANVQADVASLVSAFVNYPTAPILTQLAENFTTYGKWLAGQDGGSPTKIVQTISDHIVAVAGVMVTYSVLAPLSFVGPFIAPGVMLIQLVADTAKYPSTPQTVLQAFVDAPAVFLNIAFNCCSTQLFSLAFGLLNPGPIGYLLSFGPSIADALKIKPEPAPDPDPPAAAKQLAPGRAGVAQSRRTQSVTATPTAAASRTAKRPNAASKSTTARATTASPGKGQSARPANPGTR